jgi:hypothetical protein
MKTLSDTELASATGGTKKLAPRRPGVPDPGLPSPLPSPFPGPQPRPLPFPQPMPSPNPFPITANRK